MPDFLEDYKQYYKLRMQRFESNPDYPESYKSEKAIYEAVASCQTIEEFKGKLGDLNEKNAVALVIDQYNTRLKHYEAIEDIVRVKGCKRILDRARSTNNLSELITMVNEEENNNSLDLIADTIYPFPEPGFLERIRTYQEADIPEKYKARYRQYAEEEKQSLRKIYIESETNLQQWQPGWKFEYERIWKSKHRRLLPFPDNVIESQIQETKSFRHAG